MCRPRARRWTGRSASLPRRAAPTGDVFGGVGAVRADGVDAGIAAAVGGGVGGGCLVGDECTGLRGTGDVLVGAAAGVGSEVILAGARLCAAGHGTSFRGRDPRSLLVVVYPAEGG